jgi:hypothetical protein
MPKFEVVKGVVETLHGGDDWRGNQFVSLSLGLERGSRAR